MSNDAQALTLRVNGEDRTVIADGGDRLLTVLRDSLQLTGPKRGCNQGVCGACTVLADGKPIRSCLAIAANSCDFEITTIEGLAGDGPLTKLQQAVVEGAALQCGFCTPGMLMALTGLFTDNPTPDESAISPRDFGEYLPLYRLRKDRSSRETRRRGSERMSETIAVGRSVPRADAEEKVRGEAAYVDDMYLPGMLYGAIATSPYPHARILSYNLDQARVVAGVKATLTGDDYDLKRRSGAFIKDEMLLAKHKVRFVGEAVAAVAATSLKAAREAARLVEVIYEELPAVLSMDEAIADGAPVIHEDFGDYFSLVPLDGDGNRLWRAAIDEGDVDAAWDQCDVIVEETYETQAQHHAYMEPCGSLAKPDRDGRITVWSACQSVHLTQQRIAEWVGLPMAMVRSIAPKIGGGFGGKGSPGTQPLAAALALKTGKPVKMVLSLTERL